MEDLKFMKARHEFVRLSDLKIHPLVQREFRPGWAKQLTLEFDPDVFGEVSAVERTRRGVEEYLAFDGQHRIAAAREALGETQKIPCAIYEDLDDKTLAKMLLGRNTTKPFSALDKWPQRLIEEEPQATKIMKILAKRKLQVKNHRGPGVINAIAAVDAVFAKYGEDALEKTLDTVIDAWKLDPDGFDGSIVRGLGFVAAKFNGEINYSDLSKKLGRAGGPARLVGLAKDFSKVAGISLERALAERVVNIYNKKRTSNRLDWEVKR